MDITTKITTIFWVEETKYKLNFVLIIRKNL